MTRKYRIKEVDDKFYPQFREFWSWYCFRKHIRGGSISLSYYSKIEAEERIELDKKQRIQQKNYKKPKPKYHEVE